MQPDLPLLPPAPPPRQVCYHVVGTPQSEDVVLFAMPDHPTWMTSSGVTDDGRWGMSA